MKIPSLFKTSEHGLAVPDITLGCEWVLEGEGYVTTKLDGVNVRIINKQLMKRTSPASSDSEVFIACDVDKDSDLMKAYLGTSYTPDGEYEAVGPGIKGNPHGIKHPQVVKLFPVDNNLILHTTHGIVRGKGVSVQELFDSIQKTLSDPLTDAEGIVFHNEQWKDKSWTCFGRAKVTRKDFGLPWPLPAGESK